MAEPVERSSRYVTDDSGCIITRHDNSALHLHPQRGLAVTEQGRAQYPAQTIFLDGAFAGPPFLDNQHRHYSLDHHSGCVRPITLATCEQAVVMVLLGIPLDEGQWHLYLNDPDLDAVLAAWILLNHAALSKNQGEILWEIMPLIRTESVIDAHGLDMGVLTALSCEAYHVEKRRIGQLLSEEKSTKEAGQWESTDIVAYTHRMLDKLDMLLLGPDSVYRLDTADSVSHVALPARRIAVLCQSEQGIYDVERALKRKFPDQVGIIILDRQGGRFTLRQVDRFLTKGLGDLYEKLNEADPHVDLEHDPSNFWGGADDIGGSPRKTGSGLTAQQVLALVSELFKTDDG